MEVSHTPVDNPTRCDVWATLEALPQRVGSLLKKYETSNAGGFEDFERELRTLFAHTECAVLFRRLFRERLTGLFRRVGAGISHTVPVLPDGSVGHGQAMA